MVGLLSDEEISKILMMRGLGYSQTEIATELGITQGAVSYNLKQLKTEAGSSGLEKTFMKVLAAGIGVDRLKSSGLI
ncbi:MAG: winged helix-turn-helix transcriptional regulator [Candidatus Altiarchaeales archaeon]|nr:winged helix-turn-helix transcriptional regulator [Candidatus Altiarchaeales archaeon]MBD3417095.1 winged helix-turn-helix transcriptional regulator [Candidatus Altiarchaeales archaeon]